MRVVINQYGAPDVMALGAFQPNEPSAYEVLIRHTAIGVNYIDIFQRMGFGAEALPARLGLEAVGIVEAVGENVHSVKTGDRVAYVTAGPGAYATHNTVHEDVLIPCPEELSSETIAACLFKGLTAQYLVKATGKVSSSDVVVVQAASGGVGQLLIQWCKGLGATVIGATSSEAKADMISANGADSVHVLGSGELKDTVMVAADGRQASVVYDSVGRATFDDSISCLGMLGLLVVYGAASGPAPAIRFDDLYSRGLFVTRPSVFHHISQRDGLIANAKDLFQSISSGILTPKATHCMPLSNIVEAHKALQGRQTHGSVVLVPDAA